MILDMIDFNIIVEMSWLSLYHFLLVSHAKIVIVAMSRMNGLEWENDYSPTLMKVIFFTHTRRLIGRGCSSFLAYLQDTIVEVLSIESVPMVS